MKRTICLLAMLCPLLVFAQRSPLNVGDSLSPADLDRLPMSGSPVAGDAITILEFWSTWCGTCTRGIAKLDTLDALLGDRLEVVLINSHHTEDGASRLERFKKRYQESFNKALPFPSLVRDSVFLSLFPHEFIPHYVWLQHGRVRAITSGSEVSKANMEAMLSNPAYMIIPPRETASAK